MKLKNEIFTNGFIPAMQKLLHQPVTAAQAFVLAKLAKQINEKFEAYEQARASLLEKHGEKDKSGEFVKNGNAVKLVDPEAFETDFKELVEIEEEYDIKPLTLPDDVKITAAEALLLEDILKFD